MKKDLLKFLSAVLFSFALITIGSVKIQAEEDTTTSVSENTTDYTLSPDNWVKSGSRWWYRYEDGSYPTNSFLKIEGQYYGFDENGWMITGWHHFTGKQSNGDLHSEWYYFNPNGVMKTGWFKSGNSWYYLDLKTGAMYDDCTAEINGNTYLFTKSGALYTGWYKKYTPSGAEWYYFSDYGLITGWIKSNSKWYYMDPETAVMYADGNYEIDGELYGFDKNGAMVARWYLASEKL